MKDRPSRPNILLITSDQQHWNALGCLNPELRTPALDRLASEGACFSRAYCPNPTLPELKAGEHDRNPVHFRMTQEANPDFSAWNEAGGKGIHGMCSHLQDRDSLARDIATYYGMIAFMEDSIGKLLDYLDTSGQADNTLVVFTSDHGHFFGQHGLNQKAPSTTKTLSGSMLARWPGRIPAWSTPEALQSLVDFAPMFLEAAGLEVPGRMSGLNQLEVWQGKQKEARDHVIVENRHQPTAIHLKTYIDSRYKLTVFSSASMASCSTCRTTPEELHNLWDDPDSQNLKQELTQKLLFAEMGKESLPMPRIADA